MDVTLLRDEVMNCWAKESFYISGLPTQPLSDKDPDCAQDLNTLRQARLHACEVITQPNKVAQASDHFPLLAQIELD